MCKCPTWKMLFIVPMRASKLLFGFPFGSTKTIYARKGGLLNASPIIDAGCPKATCPRDAIHYIKKLCALNYDLFEGCRLVSFACHGG